MRPNAKNMKTNFLRLQNFGPKRPKNEQKSMKKHVFTDAARLGGFKTALPETAAQVTATGEAVRASFPELAWNTKTVWLLAFEPAVRQHLCATILQRASKSANLSCEWEKGDPQPPKVVNEILPETVERPAPLSEDARLHRKLVEMQTREARKPILEFIGSELLEVYLRTGALYIDADGKTRTAPERLDDYFTLYAETEQQAKFVAALERMREAAKEMADAYRATLELVPSTWRLELAANAGFYQPTAGKLTSDGHIGLIDADAVPRALIAYFNLTSTTAAPKFYNAAGFWNYTPADVLALTGCAVCSVRRPRKSTYAVYRKIL